jgi:hypothetical protein
MKSTLVKFVSVAKSMATAQSFDLSWVCLHRLRLNALRRMKHAIW